MSFIISVAFSREGKDDLANGRYGIGNDFPSIRACLISLVLWLMRWVSWRDEMVLMVLQRGSDGTMAIRGMACFPALHLVEESCKRDRL